MRLLIFLFILLFPITTYAQQRYTVSGYITDEQTGERLYSAGIYEQNSATGTISNRFGFFSLSFAMRLIKLKFSFVGYQSQTKIFNLDTDTLLKISLKSENTLNDIVIKGNQTHDNDLGHIKISTKTLAKLPSFMGEKDVMKSLMILPGVQQGSEGSAGIFVRGGSPDQNLVLLDDVPLYNVSHLFGFVSVFTPEAINSIDFYKGGFPARYGGRLSSVIDLRMKDGNKYKRQTNINLGIISSQCTTEGPIKNGESSYFFSVRRTLLDLIFRGAAKIAQTGMNEKVTPAYMFSDINGKVNLKLNEYNYLYWSFYSGKDKLSIDYSNHSATTNGEETQVTSGVMHWGNTMTALKLNSQINPKLFLNTVLNGSIFNYGDLFKGNTSTRIGDDKLGSKFSLEYQSQIRSIGLKTDLDIYGNSNLPYQLGFFASFNNYLPGKQKADKNDGTAEISSGEISSLDYGAFFDKKLNLGNQISLTAGLRLALYSVKNEKTYLKTEPRFSITFRPNEKSSYMASYAVMSQPIHLLSNGNIGLPTDIWVPSTKLIQPETSDILSIGLKKTIRSELKLSVEAYYKRLDHVISFTEGEGIMDIDQNWEQKIAIGKGCAYGIETEFRHTSSKMEAWLGYTLSWNDRKFDDINRSQWFPYQYDRRHKLDVGAIYQLKNGWSASVTWTFQSGAPATYSGLDYSGFPGNLNYEITDFFTGRTINSSRIQYYPQINGVRLPAYHRMDIGFTREWKTYGKPRALSLSVYNLYSRQNPYLIFTKTKPDGTTGLKQFSLFPIIPSISYRICF